MLLHPLVSALQFHFASPPEFGSRSGNPGLESAAWRPPPPSFQVQSSRTLRGLPGGAEDEPGVQHLPERQAVPGRPEAHRRAVDLRAHLQPLHGALGRRPGPLDVHGLAALAVRERARARRDRRTASTGSTCRGRGHTTGDLDVHDVADGRGRAGRLREHRCSRCLATVSESASFTRALAPALRLAPGREDRCHLNGLALEDGRPHYVTAAARTDVADGWRERRRDGGIVIDVRLRARSS